VIIDAHLHLWVQNPEKYPWQPIGGYTPQNDASLERYQKIMRANGVDKAVLVQPTPYGWDNAYVLDCRNSDAARLRAVVLVNPLEENADKPLWDLHARGADGLRINLNLEPVQTWRNSPLTALFAACEVMRLPICLQLTPDYFPLVRAWAEKWKLAFILDHMGRPQPGCDITDAQITSLLDLAEFPRVYVKLSGLNYFSQQTAPYRDAWKLLRAVVDRFTAQRCLWGSDFPFVEDHWSCSENLATMRKEMGFSAQELDWVLGGTAAGIWW